MPTYGTIKRAKVSVEVLRGYDPMETTTLTQSYPVADGVTIKSGQVIYADWSAENNRYEWKNGCAAGHTPFIALEDSTAEDVISAGKLPGLSCAGKFEIQTGYYKADGGDYFNDQPLTYDGTTGDLKVATNADVVLGSVTRIHGPISLKGKNSSAVNLNVIIFTTGFAPKV